MRGREENGSDSFRYPHAFSETDSFARIIPDTKTNMNICFQKTETNTVRPLSSGNWKWSETIRSYFPDIRR